MDCSPTPASKERQIEILSPLWGSSLTGSVTPRAGALGYALAPLRGFEQQTTIPLDQRESRYKSVRFLSFRFCRATTKHSSVHYDSFHRPIGIPVATLRAFVTTNHFDRIALRAGIIAAACVVILIYAGSERLKYFDWALTAYAIATIFATFAVTYRYAVWAQRPPTLMYLKRGWQSFRRRRQNAPVLGKRLLDNFVLQKFIARRSAQRWMMHACLSWGSMIAFALTFPLVFGWIHFETVATDAQVYRVFVFGFPVEEFPIHSMRGFAHFNLLNLAAILVLLGIVMSIKLRLSDRSEIAIQRFADDILPLLLLFIVSATGLMLTVSSNLMAGYGFQLVAIAHAASVIGLLLYLPFGKLFHIVQRPLALGVSFYKDTGKAGSRAACRRCGDHFAPQLHVEDLKSVLDQLGLNFRFAVPEGELHFQDICPVCRRRLFALNQGRAVGR